MSVLGRVPSSSRPSETQRRGRVLEASAWCAERPGASGTASGQCLDSFELSCQIAALSAARVVRLPHVVVAVHLWALVSRREHGYNRTHSGREIWRGAWWVDYRIRTAQPTLEPSQCSVSIASGRAGCNSAFPQSRCLFRDAIASSA
jgi:hypothetical protein